MCILAWANHVTHKDTKLVIMWIARSNKIEEQSMQKNK